MYRPIENCRIFFAEVFSRYKASDHKGIYQEYERAEAKRSQPLRTLPLDP